MNLVLTKIFEGLRHRLARDGRPPWSSVLADAVPVLLPAGMAISVNVAVFTATNSLPCLWPDSLSYLEWSVMRTPGYPAFLAAILAVFGDMRWIVPIQLNILLASVACLGWAVQALFQSRLAALLVVLPLFATTPLLLAACDVLTEALFASLLCLHVASVFALLRTKSRQAALAAGVTMGLVIAVRPVGYALLAATPLLLLFLRERWRAVVPALAGGLAAVVLAAGAAQYVRHGLWGTQALGGLAVAAHVSPIITAELDNGYPELTREWAGRLAPLTGDLQKPSSLRVQWQVSQAFSPDAWRVMTLVLDEYVRKTEPALDDQQRLIRMNDIATAVAWSAVRNRPGWYVRHAAAHYYGLWNGFVHGYGPIAYHAIRCRQQTIGILEAQGQAYGPRFPAEPYRALIREGHAKGQSLEQWVDVAWDHMPYQSLSAVELVFAITLVALPGLFFGGMQSDRWQGLAYGAVMIHASFLAIALMWSGYGRYTVPLLPIFVVELVGGVWLAVSWIVARAAVRAPSH